MRKALIVSGAVWEVLDVDPWPEMHPDLMWVECPVECEPGWLYDGKEFTPPPGPSLEAVAAAQLAAINAACRAAIEGGFVSTALGDPHAYPAKEHDQLNLIGQHARAVATDQPQVFWCVDATGAGAYRPHTAAQLAQVMQDGGAHKETQLLRAATLKAQVEGIVAAGGAAEDVAAISW